MTESNNPQSPPPLEYQSPRPEPDETAATKGTLLVIGAAAGVVLVGGLGFGVFAYLNPPMAGGGTRPFTMPHWPMLLFLVLLGGLAGAVIGVMRSRIRWRMRWLLMGLLIGAAGMSLVEGLCFIRS
jgi:hypothetical protein